jgi:hypothetical protein
VGELRSTPAADFADFRAYDQKQNMVSRASGGLALFLLFLAAGIDVASNVSTKKFG